MTTETGTPTEISNRMNEAVRALGPGAAVLMKIHRVFAHHRPWEFCSDCPWAACRHCGNVGDPGEDHTCPCPYSDDACPDHRDA